MFLFRSLIVSILHYESEAPRARFIVKPRKRSEVFRESPSSQILNIASYVMYSVTNILERQSARFHTANTEKPSTRGNSYENPTKLNKLITLLSNYQGSGISSLSHL